MLFDLHVDLWHKVIEDAVLDAPVHARCYVICSATNTCHLVRQDTVDSADWWDTLWRNITQLNFRYNGIFRRIRGHTNRTHIWVTWKNVYKDVQDRTSLATLLNTIRHWSSRVRIDGHTLLLTLAEKKQINVMTDSVDIRSTLLNNTNNIMLEDTARIREDLATLLGSTRLLQAERLTKARLAKLQADRERDQRRAVRSSGSSNSPNSPIPIVVL